jgi:CheY-like chemotaxis protein
MRGENDRNFREVWDAAHGCNAGKISRAAPAPADRFAHRNEKNGRPMEVQLRKSPRFHGVILHVEDDEEVRLATATLLTVAGFDVRPAASADEALAIAGTLRTQLDVLIVDYHLGSHVTGTELAETIVRRLGHGVPTIILTGDPANAEVPWLTSSPVWLLRKPVSPLMLVAGIHPLVDFRRAMRRVANIDMAGD